jgi:hypothetical protein
MDDDLGSDFAGIDDLTPDLGEVTGRRCLLEALASRLLQPRGLFYDADYGFDTRTLLSEGLVPKQFEAVIASQINADERVASSSVEVRFDARSRTLEIRAEIVDAEGPFELVLDPSDLRSVLRNSQI